MREFVMVGAVRPTARHRRMVGHSVDRSPGYRVLPGLRLAANSLRASIDDLTVGGSPFRSIDTRRLCAASFDAGRLIGYMEALEATDRGLARQVAGELSEVLDSLDDVRRQFERRSRQR